MALSLTARSVTTSVTSGSGDGRNDDTDRGRSADRRPRDGDDGFVFPSDVLFGSEEYADTLFCSFANQSPEQGAILRTGV
jgi:hypothetical protein